MKTYPSVGRDILNKPIYAFDKLDGSNIRAEWSKKNGFCKFGSRKRLLDESDKLLGEAKNLVLEKYSDDLSKIFREQRWQKAVAFFEFHGPSSFAGSHVSEETKTVTLFDVAGDKNGILEPKDFLKRFGHLDIASLLYQGNANSDFVAEVKEGRLEGMTFEGVVCKGKSKSPGLPLMFKIKNQLWIDKLHSYCKNDTKLIEELI
jgi:hypothetical protein